MHYLQEMYGILHSEKLMGSFGKLAIVSCKK